MGVENMSQLADDNRRAIQSVLMPELGTVNNNQQNELQALLAKFQAGQVIGMQDGSGTTASKPNSGAPQVNKGQSIIVKSSNPLGVKGDNPDFNFDIQSKSSAYFLNEEDMQDYEEKIQSRIATLMTQIEKKTETLQKDFQNQRDEIMEEIAELKYGRMAEVRAEFKNVDPSDEEKQAEKDKKMAEIQSEIQLKQ